MRIAVVASSCVLLAIAGCSGENQSIRQGVAPPEARPQAAVVDDAPARVKERLGFSPWITDSYSEGGARATYVAFFDGDAPAAIFERQDLGDDGENRVAYYYSGNELVAFEKWARILSAAGAPSDGWYETETVIEFANGRFVRGRKTVNGAPAEPDEHEVRAAGRTGAEMKARVIAGRESSPLTGDGEPGAQMIVRGALDAGEDVALPRGTIARVQIQDVSKQDVAAEILASVDIPVERLPASFALTTARSSISANAEIAVSARVTVDDRLLYINASRTPVDPAIEGGFVVARLTKVNPPAETALGTGAGGMMITPPQDAYECGGERLLIAIEAGGAFVTFSDRSTALLPLLPAKEAAPEKIFTNGAATIFLIEAGERRLRFARGRAAALDCIRS